MTKYEGMIGPRRCEKALESILKRINDSHVTNVVTRLLHDFRIQCKSLRELVVEHDRAFAIDLLELCKHHALEVIKKRGDIYSSELISHWQCCLVARYRDTIKQFKEFPTKRQMQNARIKYHG